MVQRFGCEKCKKVFKKGAGAVCQQCGSRLITFEMKHTIFYPLMLLFAFLGLGATILTFLGIAAIFFLLMFPLLIISLAFDLMDERAISKKALERMLSLPPIAK